MEGIVKFNPIQEACNIVSENGFRVIDFWRSKLFDLKQIGVYEKGDLKGIGYGNISIRQKIGFIISGSQTGGTKRLERKHYLQALKWDFQKNELIYNGTIVPSSESLTHAAVYDSSVKVGAVIHIHNKTLWEKLKNRVPTTSSNVSYGTPEMAREIRRLFRETEVQKHKIIVMAGHEEGILTFGKTLNLAGETLLSYLF